MTLYYREQHTVTSERSYEIIHSPRRSRSKRDHRRSPSRYESDRRRTKSPRRSPYRKYRENERKRDRPSGSKRCVSHRRSPSVRDARAGHRERREPPRSRLPRRSHNTSTSATKSPYARKKSPSLERAEITTVPRAAVMTKIRQGRAPAGPLVEHRKIAAETSDLTCKYRCENLLCVS